MVTATRYTENHAGNDQVIRLFEAYQERGDRWAIEHILTLHSKFLHHLVRRYAGSSDEPYEDLLQVGYVGLIRPLTPTKLARGRSSVPTPTR